MKDFEIIEKNYLYLLKYFDGYVKNLNLDDLKKLMNNQNLNEFIKIVVGYSFEANKYFNDSEPWSVKKSDPERMQTILFTICEQIKNISIL